MIRCPACNAELLLLNPTKKLRAALTLAGDLGDPEPRRQPRRVTSAGSRPELTPPSPPKANAVDRMAIRRAIYKKHGTDTVKAAEEFAKWERENP